MKAILIILSLLINANFITINAVSAFKQIKIEFYYSSALYQFIDEAEAANLPGNVYFNSDELSPFRRHAEHYIIFRYDENITNENMSRLIHQHITADIKKIDY